MSQRNPFTAIKVNLMRSTNINQNICFFHLLINNNNKFVCKFLFFYLLCQFLHRKNVVRLWLGALWNNDTDSRFLSPSHSHFSFYPKSETKKRNAENNNPICCGSVWTINTCTLEIRMEFIYLLENASVMHWNCNIVHEHTRFEVRGVVFFSFRVTCWKWSNPNLHIKTTETNKKIDICGPLCVFQQHNDDDDDKAELEKLR